MSEPKRTHATHPADDYDEPVFDAQPLPVDEPVFAPVTTAASAATSAAKSAEPVFEAVPAQARGVSLPVDVAHSQVGWETGTLDGAAAQTPTRRLGRPIPGWMILSAGAVVVLLVLWYALGRETTDEPVVLATPASGVVGSVVLATPEAESAAAEPTAPPADPAPDVSLSAGMHVAVANTSGQGIRLRSSPGTGALTLGIYNDGAPFLVLSPGGDYGDYPVEADGYFWYRIRVVNDPADQLVGWAAGDFLVVSGQ